MSKRNDREHFEDYRNQTRVKHEILEAYLGPYFRIVGSTNRNPLYIHGFAGRGSYTKGETGEKFDGSPLRALKLIAGNQTFSAKVSTVFVEADSVLFASLEATVNESAAANPQMRPPTRARCTFVEGMKELLKKRKDD
jgi:three-Cys-motif partner protein